MAGHASSASAEGRKFDADSRRSTDTSPTISTRRSPAGQLLTCDELAGLIRKKFSHAALLKRCDLVALAAYSPPTFNAASGGAVENGSGYFLLRASDVDATGAAIPIKADPLIGSLLSASHRAFASGDGVNF